MSLAPLEEGVIVCLRLHTHFLTRGSGGQELESRFGGGDVGVQDGGGCGYAGDQEDQRDG
jgi:hypothetical protein